MSDAPPKTHNLPPLAELIPIAVIDAQIDAVKAPLAARRDELVASGQRFITAHPTIESDETDALAAQVLAVLARYSGKSGPVETARIELLKPLRAAVTLIGSYERGPFANLIDSVESIAITIRKASIAFKQAKEAEVRRVRQAEADRLAAEARKAEEEALKGRASLDDAAAAYEGAEKAQEAAEAKPAELTRSHGDALGTTSLRYKRIVTIVEPAKVDRAYCIPDLGLLTRAAGKPGTVLPVLAGCSVADVPDLTVRR
jgi:hypothetical protein